VEGSGRQGGRLRPLFDSVSRGGVDWFAEGGFGLRCGGWFAEGGFVQRCGAWVAASARVSATRARGDGWLAVGDCGPWVTASTAVGCVRRLGAATGGFGPRFPRLDCGGRLRPLGNGFYGRRVASATRRGRLRPVVRRLGRGGRFGPRFPRLACVGQLRPLGNGSYGRRWLL